MNDVVEDVQHALQQDDGIQALVAAPHLGKDDGWVNGWIFDSQLSSRIENTQRCAIVVSYGGGWDAPDPGSTARFPMVIVDIWADPTRSVDNSVWQHDAKTKCLRIYQEVFRLLHRVDRGGETGGGIYFNGNRYITSESLGEPDLQWVQDGNGARMLRARFGLSY